MALKLKFDYLIYNDNFTHVKVIGTLYIWGSISPYISSYLKSKDPNVTRQQISMIYPFMGFLVFLSNERYIYI